MGRKMCIGRQQRRGPSSQSLRYRHCHIRIAGLPEDPGHAQLFERRVILKARAQPCGCRTCRHLSGLPGKGEDGPGSLRTGPWFILKTCGHYRHDRKMRGFLRSMFPEGSRDFSGEVEEPAAILFTSGSEGIPKGVCLSHENIIANVWQALSRIDIGPDDYLLTPFPSFTASGSRSGSSCRFWQAAAHFSI